MFPERRTWDKYLGGRSFLRGEFRKQIWRTKEGRKAQIREHYWGHCCRQQGSILLGLLSSLPDVAQNHLPGRWETGALSHTLLSPVCWELHPMALLAWWLVSWPWSRMWKGGTPAWGGKLAVQRKHKLSQNCPPHLQLKSEVGLGDICDTELE